MTDDAIAADMAAPPESLADRDFAHLVRVAPLVSIDLIVRNTSGEILLGRRNFEPAKNWFFVPGGRILKDERIGDAFTRIARNELGCALAIADAAFLGVYEHFYATNRFALEGFGTHYVVLAYQVRLGDAQVIVPDDQHSVYQWMAEEELLARGDVHAHVKAYFRRADQ